YQLSQDLLALFILPGFITTRLGDAVGVLHLMALTLIVSQALRGQVRLRWRRLLAGTLALLLCLGLLGTASRWYLATTSLKYNLGERLLALEIPSSYNNVVVYKSRADVPPRSKPAGSTLARVKSDQVLRVGYHPDHLPYSFFNRHQRLVGMDVELMHRLAERLQVRLEFVPYAYSTVVDQLESGEIDVAIGGLMMTPNRLLHVGFTHSYQTATVAVLLPDHRRGEFDTWDDPHMAANMRLAVVYEDLAAAARRQLPKAEIIVIGSLSEFFTNRDHGHDGLIISAEEGAAWCVLYPEHAVAVPKPVVQRPVGLGVRLSDADWLRFLDRWLEFEEMDGSLDRLRTYWIEGGGTKQTQPRWCILRDVLHWLP
ncbi:MAG: substrate-binding periplasmic protein, partial [Pirellulales bacterium]